MNSPNKSTILSVTKHVSLNQVETYETLVKELHVLFETHAGFQSVDVVRHPAEQQMEYTILLRFQNDESAESWKDNETIMSKLSQIEEISGAPVNTSKCVGLGMWVEHTSGANVPKLPPFWKRLILSVIGVFPTLLLLNAVIEPFTHELPTLLKTFITVVLLSGLLINPIMPALSKVMQPWLSKE